MKIVAIALSIFPGSLFVIALVSFVICGIAELGLPGGSANIGLGILFLALIFNIPTILAWSAHFAMAAWKIGDESRARQPTSK